jgi:hypothetical protein
MGLRNSRARYALDRSSNKKAICPSCGKKEFRRYVDRLTGELLPENVGICERVNNCGHNYTAMDWIKDGGTPKDSHVKYIPPPPPRRTDWRAPKRFVDMTDPQGKPNKLLSAMAKVFGPEVVKKVVYEYRVGTYPEGSRHPELKGATVYWQIGSDGQPRSGKVIQYDSNGKRSKEVRATWMHTILTGKNMEDIGCAQVLFGEHLLSREGTVCIVEGEKTALICAIIYPEYIWLAAGGMNGLSLSKCLCLTGRDVIIFPDSGCYSDKETDGRIIKGWNSMGMDIEPMTNSLYVSDVLEAIGAPEGDDIADWLFPTNRLRGVELFPMESKENVVADYSTNHLGHVFEDEYHPPPKTEIPTSESSLQSPVERILSQSQVAHLFNELDLDKDNITIKPLA